VVERRVSRVVGTIRAPKCFDRQASTEETSMFKAIVVGTDGSSRSRQAVAVAADLARTHGASLHLVHAFRAVVYSAGATGDPMTGLAASTDVEIERSSRMYLEELASEIRRDGVSVDTYCVAQSAASAILDVAESQDADLVVVGNRGMTGARRVLGSVPNSVAHGAHCAVLIVPTG
jgi:nucleotide-binding universal stress UspA family protein